MRLYRQGEIGVKIWKWAELCFLHLSRLRGTVRSCSFLVSIVGRRVV